jgi:hypothetical protein
MSSIQDLLGKILGSGAEEVIGKLTGLTSNGSDNFTDALSQMKSLFETKQDMLGFLAVGWDKTKGGLGSVTDTSATMASFLKIVSDSANFVDGIKTIKATMTKESALFLAGQMWDSVSLGDVEAVVEPIPEVVVIPEVDTVPVEVEIPAAQLGNSQGFRCFYGANSQAQAKNFATAVQAAQKRAGHAICKSAKGAWYCRAACFSGGCQACYGPNTFVNAQAVKPCNSTGGPVTTSTCTDGQCTIPQASTCSTSTCSTKPVSTCSTGKCPNAK